METHLGMAGRRLGQRLHEQMLEGVSDLRDRAKFVFGTKEMDEFVDALSDENLSTPSSVEECMCRLLS